MNITLTPTEIRVLGCLMEKEMGTPEYYPLTLNALVAACNQKNNRDPVMSMDEATVAKALEELRYQKHLVLQVTSTGSRAPKYKHNLPSLYAFTREQMAILCELFIRGPQTVGELRGHAGRMCPFNDLAAVESNLTALTQMSGDSMVVQLPREPGRREPRWAHLFGGPVEVAHAAAPPAPEPAATPVAIDTARMAALEQDLATLKKDIEDLKNQLARFQKQPG